MKNELQEYVKIPVKKLSKMQLQEVEQAVLFMKGKLENFDIFEIKEIRKDVQPVLYAKYNKILKNQIAQEESKINNQILLLAFGIIQGEITDYEELKQFSQQDYNTFYQLFHNSKYLSSVLSEELYDQVIMKIAQFDIKEAKQQRTRAKERADMQLLYSLDHYFAIYLSSRFNYSEMEQITGLCKAKIDFLLNNGFMEDHYSSEFIQQVKNKSAESKVNKPHANSNKLLIKDLKLIKIVNPDIIKVSEYQMKLLNLVSLFFEYHGSIENMVVENKNIPSYNYVLSSLLDENIQNLLNEESYDLLEKLLNVEKHFSFLKIPEKRKLMGEMIQYYYVFNGNIFKLLQNVPYSKEEVFRVLQERFIQRTYGQDVYQKIQESIAEYQDKEYVIKELQKVQVKRI